MCGHPIWLRIARPEGKTKTLIPTISNIDHIRVSIVPISIVPISIVPISIVR
jgi:hypothetical protein